MAAFPSGPRVESRYTTNPRCCSTSDSVSLSPAPKKQKTAHLSVPEKDFIAARRLADLRQSSSGESSSDLSGSTWYAEANNSISQSLRDAADYNTEPPFFMANQMLYGLPPQTSLEREQLFGRLSHDESETDDLREVIDDLTVENKRLKQRLRSHKRRQLSGTSDADKLFEVRMHGLSLGRKRELEALLTSFASSIRSSAGSTYNSPATRRTDNHNRYGSASLGLAPNAISNLKHLPTDSGYGSNSGHASVALSNGGRSALPLSNASKDRSVGRYLQDIPDSLLPRRPLVMSEKSMMALVVRKLEQLFTGKIAVPGEHSQPVQQQEIAQSAARADQQEAFEKHKSRHAEGSREAHILPHDIINPDTADHGLTSPSKLGQVRGRSDDSDQSAPEGTGNAASRPMSPDQRPTRPLDLDIERQVTASENINYIRHLGLSSPHIGHPDDKSQGWMYLNLLIGMAQLHTINVTPDFIRRAIKTCSSKFELSEDGHKVRWNGGCDVTAFSQDEERALESANTAAPDSTDGLVTRCRSSGRSKNPPSSSNLFFPSIASEAQGSRQLVSKPSKKPAIAQNPALRPATPFDYRPLVFTGKHSPATDDSLLNSSIPSDTLSLLASGGLVHALSRSKLNRGEGLITFYSNNAYFCSDFSVDNGFENRRPGVLDPDSHVLGMHPSLEYGESPLRYADACYFTPQYAVQGFDAVDANMPSFLPLPIYAAGEDETLPMELPVSGLGGVMPADNFALDVKIERRQMMSTRHPGHKRCFTGSEVKLAFDYRVVSTNRIDLRPSQLPPPSYIFFGSDSSLGAADPDMLDNSDASSSTRENDLAAPALLMHLSSDSSGSPSTSDSFHEDEEEDIDMLSTAAGVGDSRLVAGLAATLGTGTACSVAGSGDSSGDERDGYHSESETNDD